MRVKLTDHGRAIHAADNALSCASADYPNLPKYTPPKEDEDGWSEWQLWTLMEAFGKHTHPDFDLCFEPTIELVTPNWKRSNAKFNGGL